MEHVQESSGAHSPLESSQTPSVIAKLDAANRRLRDSKARHQAATALNRLLATAAKGLDEPSQRGAVAQSLLSLLDDPVFKTAGDPNGNSCRVAAVGAMLELGYPAALKVHPDDLMFYRQRTRRSSSWPALLVVVAATVLAVLFFYLLLTPTLSALAPSFASPQPKVVTPPTRFLVDGVDIENTTDDTSLIADTIAHGDLDTAMLLLARAETPAKRLIQLPMEVIVFHLQGDSKNADIAYEQLKLLRPSDASLPGLARLLNESK